MNPQRYCREAIEQHARERQARAVSRAEQQRVVILSQVAQQDRSAREFERYLRLLIEAAERQGWRLLAAAARQLLRDWEAAAAGPDGAPPA